MAFDIKATLVAVQSHLLAGGYFGSAVQVGEPKAPPQAPLSAAIFMADVAVVSLTLSSTIERHTMQVRIYKDMLAEPEENVEMEVARVVSDVMADLVGEYDLGTTVRNVDVGGQHGGALAARWGYVDVGGKMYRVADITVGLIIDGSATMAS